MPLPPCNESDTETETALIHTRLTPLVIHTFTLPLRYSNQNRFLPISTMLFLFPSFDQRQNASSHGKRSSTLAVNAASHADYASFQSRHPAFRPAEDFPAFLHYSRQCCSAWQPMTTERLIAFILIRFLRTSPLYSSYVPMPCGPMLLTAAFRRSTWNEDNLLCE